MAFKQRGGTVINCNTGGGHCGGGGLAGDAWKFMQDHPFGIDPEPYAAGLPAGFAAQCKIFCSCTGGADQRPGRSPAPELLTCPDTP
jgi:hypothetical protein